MALDFKEAQELWKAQAKIEASNNFRLRYQHGRGPCNIFILDTSSSLGEEGFAQMKDVFKTILDGYANYPEIDENVSVIVCGGNTRFLHYYSNQYSEIKKCVDDVEFGGLTPLAAAFFLSLGGIETGPGISVHSRVMNDFHIHPRIILISDGKPTDFTCLSGAEDSPYHERLEDKDQLLQLTRKIGRRQPIFCMPIGNDPDVVFLEFISAHSRGGKIVYPFEAKQFAKYSKNMQTASLLHFTMKNDGNDREMILTLLACNVPEEEFTEMDQDDIFDICTKKSLYNPWEEIADEDSDEMDDLHKERFSHLPSLGTRVIRGPDWKYDNQDNYGPGTVVGHLRNGWLLVEWDRTGLALDYRYGSAMEKDKYDVIVCDKPRILENDLIAVGCLVKRGSDWKWGNQDGGNGTIGSVYRVKGNRVIWVRWPNGLTCDYRFGYHGKFDIHICDPFSSESIEYLQDQKRKATLNRAHAVPFKCPENTFTEAAHSVLIGSSRDHDSKYGETSRDFRLPSSQRLKVTKGCYFKNDRIDDDVSSDKESDEQREPSPPIAVNQWMWKDGDGKWNPYPRKINDRINKCHSKNPNSTVVVAIKEHCFRVVMSKTIQIDLMTRETFEVKLVKNE